MVYKTIDIRLFPTKKQEEIIWKHINACRFVWNYMLNYQENLYKSGNKEFTSGYKMGNVITKLRKEPGYEWLNEVAVHSLKNECQELGNAYIRFFSSGTIPRSLIYVRSIISSIFKSLPCLTAFLSKRLMIKRKFSSLMPNFIRLLPVIKALLALISSAVATIIHSSEHLA